MLTTDGAQKLAHRHPWLYHVVWRADGRTRDTVASDGLASGKSRRYWHPLYKPRPGHVYLATMRFLNNWPWAQRHVGDDLYAVRSRCLVPSCVNPDEDHFAVRDIPACDRFHLPRPADMELWKTFGSAVVPSYGDWADQVDLGSDPAHTVHSINGGTLAYAGVVPPTALLRWDDGASAWFPIATSGDNEIPATSSPKEKNGH